MPPRKKAPQPPKQKCSEPGCWRDAYTRGLCQYHRNQEREKNIRTGRAEFEKQSSLNKRDDIVIDGIVAELGLEWIQDDWQEC